jgi:sterol desaturase/sphingolipid hydroxylase (fatty acid hydroxylase superfamily)
LSIEIIELFFIFFHHANISFSGENLLSQVIITPSIHRSHHSTIRAEHDSNYGIVLSFWDRMFNTRKELVPENIGLDLIGADNFIQLFSLAFITERKIMKLFSWLPKGKK